MSSPDQSFSPIRALQMRMDELEAAANQADALKSGGGDGTSGSMSDDWKSGVNTQLQQLHQDVRHLLYGLIGAAVLLAGAGWTAYSKLSDQVSDFRVLQAETNGKIDVLIERTAQRPSPTDAAPTN